jgi:tetratricopeptide (TPR) repeat protein/transcriptional regulator with XRE-family HTH domain
MGERGLSRFGPLLRSRRLAAGLTQEEFADRAGLSVRAIRDLERGVTGRPYRKTVALLASALGLDEAGRGELAGAARQSPGDGAAWQPPGDGADSLPDVPRQLPAAVGGFAGRAVQLGALTGLLDQVGGPGGTVVISAIGGIAGVGKTTLAVRWAHQVAGEFRDGQLYVNLRGFGPGGPPVAPATVVRDFLEALGVPADRVPVQADAQAGLYRSMMAGKRMLVVLDNARDSEQVGPLLPGSSGCLTLVTSRAPLAGLVAAEGARLVPVDVLSPAEARELLALRLGAERVASELAAAEEIVQLTARLPLALSIVAARAAAHPGYRLAALATELRDARGRLDALSGGEVSADVRAAFSWSCERLSEAAERMFRLLSVHPGPEVSIAAAASLAGIGRPQARRALAELTAAGLLTEPAAGRYAFHDLVRAYAAELSGSGDTDGDRAAATHRMLDHYLHTARAARLLVNPTVRPLETPPPQPGVCPEEPGDYARAMKWFAAERPVLLSALSAATRSGFDLHAQQLPTALSAYLQRSGQWQEWEVALHAGLAAAQRRGDVTEQGLAHLDIGCALGQLGRYDEAPVHLHDALRLFVRTDDHRGQGRAHIGISVALGGQRHFDQALVHARQALACYRLAGRTNGQAMALNLMGCVLTELGHHDQSLDCCRRGLELCGETGNRELAALTRDTMGLAYHNHGRYARALACYLQAIRECRELGCRWGEAEALMHLGDTHLACGDAREARRAWRVALAILVDLSHPDADEVRVKLGQLDQPETQAEVASS